MPELDCLRPIMSKQPCYNLSAVILESILAFETFPPEDYYSKLLKL